jgi:hypothetical protein
MMQTKRNKKNSHVLISETNNVNAIYHTVYKEKLMFSIKKQGWHSFKKKICSVKKSEMYPRQYQRLRSNLVEYSSDEK